MDRVLTRFFSISGLHFAYGSSQLCTGVYCSWECFQFLVFTAVSAMHMCSLCTLGFFLKWLFLTREENEHADSFIQL